MPTFKFDMADLKPLIEHALAASEHRPTFDMLDDPAILKEGVTLAKGAFAREDEINYSKIPPHLQLVKDSGAYLMSSGRPLLEGDGTLNKVVYAKGFKPEDGYIGGDDYIEKLEIEHFKQALDRGEKTATVRVSETTMSLSFAGAPRPKQEPARPRPAYSKSALLAAVLSSGADAKKSMWANPNGSYEGEVVFYDSAVMFQKVDDKIVAHELALLPEPRPEPRSIATIAYPAHRNAKATILDVRPKPESANQPPAQKPKRRVTARKLPAGPER